VRGQGERWAATASGAVLAASMWAPWFSRRVAGGFAALPAVTGWRALGRVVGAIVVVTGVVAVAWAWSRRRPSGALVVALGALSLLAAAATVGRIGVDGPVTTSPAPGLVLAFVGAAGAVLAGIVALLRR